MEHLAYLLLLLYSPNIQHSVSEIILSEQGASATSVLVNDSNSINETADLNHVRIDQFAFEDSLQNLYDAIGLVNYDLSYEVFKYGMIGYFSLRQDGKLSDKKLLSIIDFTKSSSKKRFYTIDLDKLRVKYHTYVSHGKNTGEDLAKEFSNTVQSNQSSLGFYVTAETYVGSKGYSLKLDGVEKGYNDNLRKRAVVMHNAEYVSEYWIKQYGRLGRSQGCPALPKDIAREVINCIKDHTAIFAYYNDETYLSSSSYLNLDTLLAQNMVTAASLGE